MSITASTNGPSVVASLAVESLSTIEERGDLMASDPGTVARVAAVGAHIDSYAVSISKVFRD